MGFPEEFLYGSEDEFTEKLVVPLLSRIGFSIVMNYHGANEYGKDLIIGEIDRFAHLRYYGVQVKYESSISQAKSHELINDCEEAFNVPFEHPHTGKKYHISSFYVINGGTFSDNAKTTFFRSVGTKFGENTYLLDGKALLQLDRITALHGAESMRSSLNGMLIELKYNVFWMTNIRESLGLMFESEGGYPVQRLSSNAIEGYLQNPFFPAFQDTETVFRYWQCITIFNRIVDSIGLPVTSKGFKEARLNGVDDVMVSIRETHRQLWDLINKELEEIGPLVAL
ncbi:hypothetical protein [Gimesia maris]|uniref:hypothetical protein n=1 Tax=Gimesia maris TaxID=122 RepID=UPI0030D76219